MTQRPAKFFATLAYFCTMFAMAGLLSLTFFSANSMAHEGDQEAELADVPEQDDQGMQMQGMGQGKGALAAAADPGGAAGVGAAGGGGMPIWPFAIGAAGLLAVGAGAFIVGFGGGFGAGWGANGDDDDGNSNNGSSFGGSSFGGSSSFECPPNNITEIIVQNITNIVYDCFNNCTKIVQCYIRD